uniref:Acyl-CoA dehydrogenase family member 10 n=1 Tax=Sus scrofa TaxID=9823 RepID=A0A8D2BGW3_PIG
MSLFSWRSKAEILYFLNFSEFQIEPTWHHGETTGICMVIPLFPKLQPFDHILFHLLNVLLLVEWEVRNHIPSGTVLKALSSGGENGPWMKFMRAEITIEDFLQEFRKLCSEISKTDMSVDFFSFLLTNEQVVKQFPVMTEAITQIRAKGLQTALLSNNFFLPNGKSFLPLDRKQFDVVVESCLEGICKPDPRIYKLCLERLGRKPSECILLEDLGPNLKAAASLGIHTIKVNDPETAVKELKTLLGFTLRTVVPNTRPVRKTMEIPKDSLEKYLRDLLGIQTTGPLELLQFDHGQSNPTYYIKLANQQMVLRKKPPGTLLPSAHAVEREFRIMKALKNAGVPVPKVLDLCEDSRIVGTPFYVMEYCSGLTYKDPSLPGLEPSQRQAIYTAMNRVLCKIHSVDLKATGLEDYGKHGDYITRQVQTWIKQYRATETSTIPAMERLIEWLPLHLPSQQRTTVVHGDFRLDNLLFHPETNEVLAVLDWELSTLGDPLADVAYSCLAHYLPSSFPIQPGLGDCDLTKLGIPTAEEYFRMYCLHMGIPPTENWNFYMAFSFFRIAAILQGVYKRSLTGQASSATAEQSGKLTEFMSNLAWDFAVKEGFRVFKEMPPTKPLTRSHHMWARPQFLPRTLGRRSYVTSTDSSPAHASKGALVFSPEGLSPPVREVYQRLKQFIERHVYPAEPELQSHQASAERWTPSPLVEDLKEKAKAEGLWNLFLPIETDPERKYGAGLTNVEYAHLCELMGTSLYAPEAKSRVAFGKPLVEQGTILADIAQSRVEIEQARLLVLKAAHVMDVAGNKAAALDIAMIKMVAPSMASRVIDRAIQAFGAAGLSNDFPLAQFFAGARALRFADGPDEVHRAAVAKMELKHGL